MQLIAQYLAMDHRSQLGTLDIALLIRALESKGADLRALLAQQGIAEYDWSRSESTLSYTDKLKLFRAAVQLYPNEGLGLLAGRQMDLHQFGVLGYAIRTSPSVLDAVKTGFKYLRLNGPLFTVRLTVDGERAALQIEEAVDISELLPFCCEFFLAAVVSIYRQLTGQAMPLIQLSLPYSSPIYCHQYRSVFDCPVHFNQANIELIFPRSALELPVAQYDAVALKHSLRSCQAIVETLESPQSLVQQIKSRFYQQPMTPPSLEELAQDYGCSSRTMRREIAKYGVTYQAIRNEVMASLATELLLQTELTVEEIGYRLGYSDVANFRRAFRTMTKLTPSSLRSTHVQGEASFEVTRKDFLRAT
ncbi:AraC family transcriptional regulator [Vibrio sp. 16]|uniref:AraC family transcriptional regulator n=1 Tax=Vibrio sp. 16 TaxID=391586 RepID=UPI002FF05C47